MIGNAINNFTYTGIVTVSRYKHGKKSELFKITNNGGQALFDFFTMCLCGNYKDAELLRPTGIMLVNESDGSPAEMIAYSAFIEASTIEVLQKDDTRGCVRYSFLVHKDAIYEGTFNSICLYNTGTAISGNANKLNNYSAKVAVTADEVAEISASDVSALIIDWELHISNPLSAAV